MSLRFFRYFITSAVLLSYLLTPLLDSMACAGCVDSRPFQCETTIGSLRAVQDELTYISYDRQHAGAPASDEHTAGSFCSVCANFLTGVEVFSPNVHTAIAPWDGPCAVPALSELHYSIDKPPQNLLV